MGFHGWPAAYVERLSAFFPVPEMLWRLGQANLPPRAEGLLFSFPMALPRLQYGSSFAPQLAGVDRLYVKRDGHW